MKFAAFVLSCLSAIALAESPISEADVWKHFTTWLQKQQPNSKPGDLIRSYRESLLRQGIPEDEARRRMEIVSNSVFTRRKEVEFLWDKVYAGSNPIFIQSPSKVVMNAIEGRKPGKALDSEWGGAGTQFT